MIGRRGWDPDRRFVVTVGSTWHRPQENTHELWQVIELWKFEQGHDRELLAVTIRNASGKLRHMSQARLVNSMREVT